MRTTILTESSHTCHGNNYFEEIKSNPNRNAETHKMCEVFEMNKTFKKIEL